MFLSSMSPDISEDIPTPLSGGGGRALAATGDLRFDISVNGLPFNLKISPQNPYKRESEQVRKDQFDTSGEPGEQSLAAWWIRSESSFHKGGGIKYYDPGSDRSTENRFATSQGVDVWKQGEVSLLRKMAMDEGELPEGEAVHLSTFRSMGRNGWVVANGNDLRWRGGDAPGGTTVRKNYSRNPRALSTATNQQNYSNTGGGHTDESATGGPTGTGYRGWEWFSADATTWNGVAISDRASAANANDVTEIADGTEMTFSCYLRAWWVGSATVYATATVGWYTAGGSTLPTTTSDNKNLIHNQNDRIVVRSTKPPTAAYARMVVRFYSSGTVYGSVRVSDFLYEVGPDLRPPFDGAKADGAGHNYAWVGAANASASTDTYTPGVSQVLASAGATQPAPVGGYVWVGHINRISRWDVNNDVLSTPWTCTGTARCWWVKNRLIVAVDENLYWVDHTQTGVLETEAGLGDKAVLLASGADDTWRWTDVSDTGDAILAAGAGETASSVFALTVTEESGLPVFSGAAEVARLPQGEQVTCMGTYLASYIVLGTTKGIRVGATGQQGQIELGPVVVELEEAPLDVSFFDRFAYLPVTRALPDGTSGVVRIDLSEPIVGEQGITGLFPWAWDVYPGGSVMTATSICFNGDTGRVVLAHGSSVHVETEELLESGHLDTGLIRYATSESKDYQRVMMTGDIRGGRVKVEALIDGVPSNVYTYAPGTGLEGEATLNLPGGPLFDELAFRFTITRTSALSPVVNTLSVKAIPAVRKSRLITFPLQVADFESTRHGNEVGYEDFGINRVEELEALENAGAAVQIIDRRFNEAMVGTIETLQFVGLDAPDREYDNDGGVVTMVVRVR